MSFAAPIAGWNLRARIALAALAGALGALGLAPFDLWPLGLLGFVVLTWALLTAQSSREGAWLAWAGGAGYFALALHWIVEPFLVDLARHGWMAPFALLLLAGGLALFWALAGWAALRLAGKAALARLVAWVTLLTFAEYLRATVLTGFPWAHPGHIWITSPLLPLAAYIGPHGLTLITLALAASFVAIAHRHWAALLLPLTLAATPLLPEAPFEESDAPMLRLIQPNAPQHLKWQPEMIPVFFARALELTAAEGDNPALVIWPETSLPTLLRSSERARAAMAHASGDVPILVGGQRFEGEGVRNTLLHLGQGGAVLARYDKHHLVPFGEYLPLSGLAARFGLRGLAENIFAGYTPGPGPQLMEVEGIGPLFPMICYETIFPSYVRQLDRRPRLMVQVTNDAWFGNFSGPFQHLALARLRAVEQGVPLVRSANTGVSAVISARGALLSHLPMNEAGFLDAPLPPRLASPPPYARFGDWPVLIILSLLIGFTLLRRKRAIESEQKGP